MQLCWCRPLVLVLMLVVVACRSRGAIIITAGPPVSGQAEVENMIRNSEQRSWCKPGVIRQIVTHPHCTSEELQNKVCTGSCFSYSLPRTIPRSPGDDLDLCESCQPAHSSWVTITLSCTAEDESQYEVSKTVQQIANCSCSSCPGSSSAASAAAHTFNSHSSGGSYQQQQEEEHHISEFIYRSSSTMPRPNNNAGGLSSISNDGDRGANGLGGFNFGRHDFRLEDIDADTLSQLMQSMASSTTGAASTTTASTDDSSSISSTTESADAPAADDAAADGDKASGADVSLPQLSASHLTTATSLLSTSAGAAEVSSTTAAVLPTTVARKLRPTSTTTAAAAGATEAGSASGLSVPSPPPPPAPPAAAAAPAAAASAHSSILSNSVEDTSGGGMAPPALPLPQDNSNNDRPPKREPLPAPSSVLREGGAPIQGPEAEGSLNSLLDNGAGGSRPLGGKRKMADLVMDLRALLKGEGPVQLHEIPLSSVLDSLEPHQASRVMGRALYTALPPGEE